MPDTNTARPARDLLSAMAFALATGQTPDGADWYPDPRSFEAAIERHRAEVLAEAADAIDEVADAAEEDAIASDGYAYGRSNPTVAVHREDAALLRRLAAAPTTPTRLRDLPLGEFGDLVQKRTTPTMKES